jgi:hypothetical protein
MVLKKKETCPSCGRSFARLNRHKCTKKNETSSKKNETSSKKNKTSSKKKKKSRKKELVLGLRYVSSIDNIKLSPDLTSLDLSHNGISEIKNLDKLVKLEVLKIADPMDYYEPDSMMGHAGPEDREYFDKITEIKGLEKLVKLKVLDLRRNEITVISGLENQIKLKKLLLLGNRIKDISGLKYLVNLEELSLAYNPVTWIDYEIVKNLTKLKICDLPIISVIKKINISKYIDVRYLYYDMSRYGQLNCYGTWDFYHPHSTKQMSTHLGVIYINGKTLKASYPEFGVLHSIRFEGIECKTEEFFDKYCEKIRRWVKSKYKSKNLPKYLTTALLRELANAGDPAARKMI